MPSARVFDMDGQVVREEELDSYVFGAPVNTAVLHQVVTAQLVNRRQGNASTKTRAQVSGGNKKPYKQKGTGRARQGSTRAPQFRGGGSVFGPRPHSYDRAIPRKMKRVAIRSALSDKAANDRILLVDNLTFEAPRTKDMIAFLDKLPIERHVLLLMPEADINVILSTRNLPQVKLGNVASTNVVELLKYDQVLMPVATAHRLVSMFGQEADDAIQMKRHPRVVIRRKEREAAMASGMGEQASAGQPGTRSTVEAQGTKGASARTSAPAAPATEAVAPQAAQGTQAAPKTPRGGASARNTGTAGGSNAAPKANPKAGPAAESNKSTEE